MTFAIKLQCKQESLNADETGTGGEEGGNKFMRYWKKNKSERTELYRGLSIKIEENGQRKEERQEGEEQRRSVEEEWSEDRGGRSPASSWEIWLCLFLLAWLSSPSPLHSSPICSSLLVCFANKPSFTAPSLRTAAGSCLNNDRVNKDG